MVSEVEVGRWTVVGRGGLERHCSFEKPLDFEASYGGCADPRLSELLLFPSQILTPAIPTIEGLDKGNRMARCRCVCS